MRRLLTIFITSAFAAQRFFEEAEDKCILFVEHTVKKMWRHAGVFSAKKIRIHLGE